MQHGIHHQEEGPMISAQQGKHNVSLTKQSGALNKRNTYTSLTVNTKMQIIQVNKIPAAHFTCGQHCYIRIIREKGKV